MIAGGQRVGKLCTSLAPRPFSAQSQFELERQCHDVDAAETLGRRSDDVAFAKGFSLIIMMIMMMVTILLVQILTLSLFDQVAVDSLSWSVDHTQFITEGFMKLTQPSDLLMTTTRSRGRALKWQNIWAALVVLNQQVKSTPFLLATYFCCCCWYIRSSHFT